MTKNNEQKQILMTAEESKGSLLGSNISPLKVYKKAAPISSVSSEQFMVVTDTKCSSNNAKKKKNQAAVLSNPNRAHQMNQ